MDRASGSGVFARDPDAMLDLIELDLTEELLQQEENKAVCEVCRQYLENSPIAWQEDVSQDDLCSQVQILAYCREKLTRGQIAELEQIIESAKGAVKARTAWRIEGTLREFQKFEPVNLWFDYPIHRIDTVGSLKDISPEEMVPFHQKGKEARKKQSAKEREKKQSKYNIAIENFRFGHDDLYPTVKELYEQMKGDAEAVGESYPAEKTIWNSLKKLGYTTDKETKRLVPLPEKEQVPEM